MQCHNVTLSHSGRFVRTGSRFLSSWMSLISKAFGPDSIFGMDNFEKAIEKDPTYAPALSGLADVADALSWYGFESPQSFVRSRQLALKAIALDDSLAEGHASLAMGLFYSD